MHAKHLIIGQSFIIPNCLETMRNAVCLRVSPTATYITGEERHGIRDEWKRVYDYIGNETNIEVDDAKPIVKVTRNSRGELGIDGDDMTHTDKNGVVTNGNGRRGRKKTELAWPTDVFIIPSLAKQLGVSTTTIYIKLMELIKAGKAKVVHETRKEGSRGRATKVYQLISEKTVDALKPKKTKTNKETVTKKTSKRLVRRK